MGTLGQQCSLTSMSNQCEATQPVTIIMTELLRQFFGNSLTVPQVFPLIGLGSLQSHCHFSQLHYLVAQSNFHRLCFSYFVAPKGSSHRVSMATPCRRDKVRSSECLSELSLILMVTLFIRILMIYPSLMCLIADWIQVCVMSPDCGPLWGCAVAHKAHCIYNLAL